MPLLGLSSRYGGQLIKRLKALWLPYYGEHFGQLAEDIVKALMAISPASIYRILKPVRS